MAEPLQDPLACPVREDLRFQKVMWLIERMGWIAMAMIVAAAMAGLLGGPTARKETRDASGRVHVEYRRFQRHLDPAALRLKIDTQGQSLFELTIGKDLAQAFEIRSVVPAPIEMQAHAGGLLMKFAASPDPASPDNGLPAEIVIVGIPDRPGRVAGGIALFGETPAPLDIFVYP